MTDTGYYDESYPPSLWTTPDPVIGSLNPNTGVANGGPYSVTVTGTKFIESSVVEVDQVAVPTVYVSETELTATYSPTAVGTDIFTVRNGGAGGEESNPIVFTVTATQEEETETEPEPESYSANPVDPSTIEGLTEDLPTEPE